jgi:hypothetical protein
VDLWHSGHCLGLSATRPSALGKRYLVHGPYPSAAGAASKEGGPTVAASCVAHAARIYIRSYPEHTVRETSQQRAVKNYRSRLGQRGMVRFEVVACATDRNLIRSLAKCLAEDGAEAERIRAVVSRSIAGDLPEKGGILAALRRSPLVGADPVFSRPKEPGRKVDL